MHCFMFPSEWERGLGETQRWQNLLLRRCMKLAVNADLPHCFIFAVPASLNKLCFWVFYTWICSSTCFDWASLFGSKVSTTMTARITSQNIYPLPLQLRSTWWGAEIPGCRGTWLAFLWHSSWELLPGLNKRSALPALCWGHRDTLAAT